MGGEERKRGEEGREEGKEMGNKGHCPRDLVLGPPLLIPVTCSILRYSKGQMTTYARLSRIHLRQTRIERTKQAVKTAQAPPTVPAIISFDHGLVEWPSLRRPVTSLAPCDVINLQFLSQPVTKRITVSQLSMSNATIIRGGPRILNWGGRK